jgi:hypothetical protein
LAGVPATRAGAGLFLRSSTGAFSKATVPDLFNGAAPNIGTIAGAPSVLSTSGSVHVNGLTFSGQQDGWLTATSQVVSASGLTAMTTVYTTTDGGATWVALSQLPA